MVLIRTKTTEEAWREAVRAIWGSGKTLVTEDMDKTKEIFGLLIKITSPTRSNDKIPEHFQLKGNAFRQYIEQVMTHENKWGFEYTYGERIWNWNNKVNQIEGAIERLSKNPSSRRAVCDVGFPEADAKLKDPPCMRLIDFKIREEKAVTPMLPSAKKLNITVIFRSHDVFGASYANWVALGNLQKYASDKISKNLGENIMPGELHSYSISAHIYERDFEAVKNMVGSLDEFVQK